jgi:hypothetical protein
MNAKLLLTSLILTGTAATLPAVLHSTASRAQSPSDANSPAARYLPEYTASGGWLSQRAVRPWLLSRSI